MSDEIPTPAKGVYIYLDYIALGFVLVAIEEFVRNFSAWRVWGGCLVLGAAFLFVGIMGAAIKARLISMFVAALRNYKLFLFAIFTVLIVAAVGFDVYDRHRTGRTDKDPKAAGLEKPATIAKKQEPPSATPPPAHPVSAPAARTVIKPSTPPQYTRQSVPSAPSVSNPVITDDSTDDFLITSELIHSPPSLDTSQVSGPRDFPSLMDVTFPKWTYKFTIAPRTDGPVPYSLLIKFDDSTGGFGTVGFAVKEELDSLKVFKDQFGFGSIYQNATFQVLMPQLFSEDLDWSPFLRQTVKTHFSLNGELSHGIVTQAVHAGV